MLGNKMKEKQPQLEKPGKSLANEAADIRFPNQNLEKKGNKKMDERRGEGVPDRDEDDKVEGKIKHEGRKQEDKDEDGEEGGDWDTGNEDDMPPEMPEDMDDKEAMGKWHHHMAKHHSKMAEKCGMMGEGEMMGEDDGNMDMGEMGGSPVTAETAGGRRPKKITHTEQYAEQVLKAIRKEREDYEKFHEERIGQERRAAIKARLDALVHQKKVTPRERDAGLDQSLYLLDASTVYRFSEGRREVDRTPLEQALALLETRPVMYSERIKSGDAAAIASAATPANDSELAKVEAQYHTFSERGTIPRGVTLETFVEGFKAARKHSDNPNLTADEYFRS